MSTSLSSLLTSSLQSPGALEGCAPRSWVPSPSCCCPAVPWGVQLNTSRIPQIHISQLPLVRSQPHQQENNNPGAWKLPEHSQAQAPELISEGLVAHGTERIPIPAKPRGAEAHQDILGHRTIDRQQLLQGSDSYNHISFNFLIDFKKKIHTNTKNWVSCPTPWPGKIIRKLQLWLVQWPGSGRGGNVYEMVLTNSI